MVNEEKRKRSKIILGTQSKSLCPKPLRLIQATPWADFAVKKIRSRWVFWVNLMKFIVIQRTQKSFIRLYISVGIYFCRTLCMELSSTHVQFYSCLYCSFLEPFACSVCLYCHPFRGRESKTKRDLWAKTIQDGTSRHVLQPGVRKPVVCLAGSRTTPIFGHEPRLDPHTALVRVIIHHSNGSHFAWPGCLHCMSFLFARTLHLPARTLPSFVFLPACLC